MRRISTAFHLISNASNNARVVRGGPGFVAALWATNTNAAIRFLKFFDVAINPIPATDQPIFVCGIPGGAAAGAGGALAIPGGLRFGRGIGFALVTGAADFNDGAVAAGEIVISFVFQ